MWLATVGTRCGVWHAWPIGVGMALAEPASILSPFSLSSSLSRLLTIGQPRRPSMRRCGRRSRGPRLFSLLLKPPRHRSSCVSLAAPVAPKGVERHDEWVQIAGYTTVVRAEPTTASPVLFAYAAGRPLRVIAREGGFARVQDLGSGQYGWVKESALAPFTGGYRQREDVAPQPQVVASAAPASVPAQVATPQVPASQATGQRRSPQRRFPPKGFSRRGPIPPPRGPRRRWSRWPSPGNAASSACGATGRSASRLAAATRASPGSSAAPSAGKLQIGQAGGDASGRGSSCSWA